MKTLMAVLTVLGASQTWAACPNMIGFYKCVGATSYELTITQAEVQGVTTYFFSSDSGDIHYVADGVEKNYAYDIDGYRKLTTKVSSCEAGNLKHSENLQRVRLEDGKLYDSTTERVTISRSEDGTLLYSGHTDYTADAEQEDPKPAVDWTINCKLTK